MIVKIKEAILRQTVDLQWSVVNILIRQIHAILDVLVLHDLIVGIFVKLSFVEVGWEVLILVVVDMWIVNVLGAESFFRVSSHELLVLWAFLLLFRIVIHFILRCCPTSIGCTLDFIGEVWVISIKLLVDGALIDIAKNWGLVGARRRSMSHKICRAGFLRLLLLSLGWLGLCACSMLLGHLMLLRLHLMYSLSCFGRLVGILRLRNCMMYWFLFLMQLSLRLSLLGRLSLDSFVINRVGMRVLVVSRLLICHTIILRLALIVSVRHLLLVECIWYLLLGMSYCRECAEGKSRLKDLHFDLLGKIL